MIHEWGKLEPIGDWEPEWEPEGRFLRLHELHELVYVAVISQRCNIWKVKKLAVSKTVGQANGISRSIILKP